MASSLMSLGLAVGGRHADAEQMAERSMNQGRKLCGGIATWAQAHIFDAGGRVSEGISALANGDGIANYEGSGFLFFDCRLGGYGARFMVDREERGRGISASLRLYERNFDRILHYSGFSAGQAWRRPMQRAPLAWKEPTALEQGDKDKSPSFFDAMFGSSSDNPEQEVYEIMRRDAHAPATNLDGWEPSLEDVLTWLPPSPHLLSDATLLLLRFTLNGTISTQDSRWDDIRNAWVALFDIQTEHGKSSGLSSFPLASLASSLLFPPSETGGDRIGNGRLAIALHLMGQQLKLGQAEAGEETTRAVRVVVADRDPNFWLPEDEKLRQEWREIMEHFSSAIDGLDCNESKEYRRNMFDSWDFEARPLLEHAICYAACKAGDAESLSLARAICSQGVTLRTNSPEEWWRYSIVLGLLGDEVGSENALLNSINLGGGQGARAP